MNLQCWIRRIIVFGLLFFISVILQSTIFHFLKIGGVKPDLILIIVILSAVMKGKKTGAGLGFAYGLMEDLLVGRYIGLQALTKMLTGYFIGFLERKIFSDNVLVPVVVGALGTFIHNLLVFIALFLVGNFHMFTPESFFNYSLASCLYNLCVSVLVYGPFYRSNTQGLLKTT